AQGDDATAFGYGTQSTTRAISMGSLAASLGDDAVAIGYNASIDANGDQGVAIGRDASVTAANAIAIGYQATNATTNSIMLGNPAVNAIRGHVNFTATSDRRMKSDVQENIPGLAFIRQLRPVSYQMDMENVYLLRGDPIPEELKAALEAKKSIRYSGFIAQEVAQAADDTDYDFSGVEIPADSTQLYGLRYAEFVVPLVKAVQELNAKVDQQEHIILSQAQQLKSYQHQLTLLETYQDQLNQYQQTMAELTAKLNQLEERTSPSYTLSD
ncbi:MAG: tail fiber domain-containing protein, partial [Bacteroidota bacterium]